MRNYILIYITDDRQKYIEKGLVGEHIACSCSDTIDYERVSDIILPTPYSKLKLEEKEEAFLLSKLKENPQIRVWGGCLPKALREGEYFDLMEDEEVALKNAQITAEATLSIATANMRRTLGEQQVLITGYGRCARACARLFNRAGAKVSIMARSMSNRQDANVDGYRSWTFSPEGAAGSTLVINTVPAPVINEDIIRVLPEVACIIDLASKPGGCDVEAANRYQIKHIHALGLPGRYCPLTAADIMLSSMRRNGLVEDDSWILSIVR